MSNFHEKVNDVCGKVAKVVIDLSFIRDHFNGNKEVWFVGGDEGAVPTLNNDIEILKEVLAFAYLSYENTRMLIGNWFCSLEDDGISPWDIKECIDIANNYDYTKEDYKKYLSSVY